MQALDTQSTPQTDTILVAAPGAARQIVVHGVFVSSGRSQTVSFESGTTGLRWQMHVAAYDGQNAQSDRHLFTCADNAALTYTSTAAANLFVSVSYEIEQTFDQTP